MTRTPTWWALVLSLAALACGEPEVQPVSDVMPHPPEPSTSGPLAAGQRASIRGVARAVLLAQRDAIEDVDIAALATELDALRGELETLLRSAPPVRILEDGHSARSAPALVAAERAYAVRAVRARIEAVRVQRMLLAAKASGSRESATAARAAELVRAAERIEVQTRDALDAPDAVQRSQLAQLHRRLQRQGLAERRAALHGEPPSALAISGNSTLTKHR